MSLYHYFKHLKINLQCDMRIDKIHINKFFRVLNNFKTVNLSNIKKLEELI